jgi:hypothetical protein
MARFALLRQLDTEPHTSCRHASRLNARTVSDCQPVHFMILEAVALPGRRCSVASFSPVEAEPSRIYVRGCAG